MCHIVDAKCINNLRLALVWGWMDSFGNQMTTSQLFLMPEIKQSLCDSLRNDSCLVPSGAWLLTFFYGEFDPGSGRTLAACLTHASRTVTEKLASSDQWRTGE